MKKYKVVREMKFPFEEIVEANNDMDALQQTKLSHLNITVEDFEKFKKDITLVENGVYNIEKID